MSTGEEGSTVRHGQPVRRGEDSSVESPDRQRRKGCAHCVRGPWAAWLLLLRKAGRFGENPQALSWERKKKAGAQEEQGTSH